VKVLGDLLGADGIEVLEDGPVPIVCPENEAEVTTLLERIRKDKLRVVPIGLGTKLAALRPDALGSGDFDLLLSTRRLREIVAYEPADGTLTAQAGARMSDLADTVRAGGHRLTPNVSDPEESTLGGVIGASLSGPDRLRYGPLRHHVLGARAALADGRIARSGGRLVKNVTGFDMHRLYCGSRGTLCTLVEASLRLFPLPERDLALRVRLPGLREAFELAKEIRLRRVSPEALTVENTSGPWNLHVFLAGGAAQLDFERADLLELAPESEVLEDEAARARSAHIRDLSRGAAARLTCLPSRMGDAVDTNRTFWDSQGVGATVVAQPGIACAEVFLEGTPDHETLAAQMVDLRERLAPQDTRLYARTLPEHVHQRMASARESSVAGDWMQRLRTSLDPAGTFSSPVFP